MEKKDLKMYEAPVVEVVELEALSVICASGDDDPESDWTGGPGGIIGRD